MQTVRQLFIKATGTFFSVWYNSTARHYVISGSQNTISLGKDQLAQFKVKLKDFTDNAEKYVNEFLSADSLWWHLSQNEGDNFVSLIRKWK